MHNIQQKNRAANQAFYSPTMSNREFKHFSEFVYARCGIKMPPAKKTMLTARLLKRLRDLGLTSYGDYYDYVNSPDGRSKELTRMIDVVTTNKTEFFREMAEFFSATRLLDKFTILAADISAQMLTTAKKSDLSKRSG